MREIKTGGKDSLALMLEISRQGYNVTGLHIDLAIPVSSAAARGVVERFCAKHGLTLMVKDMVAEGLPIPAVKERLNRPICSACGKIKRHFFNKVALDEGFDALATGHNLDDEVARLFSNTLRWDTSYLSDQGPRHRRIDGYLSILDIGLVFTDDLIGHLRARVLILKVECRAKNTAAIGIEQLGVNDLCIRQFAINLLDTAFNETLTFLGRIVFGVLRKIAMRTRLSNGRYDARPFNRLQMMQFSTQFLGAIYS